MINKPSIISCAGLRFIIMDAPSRSNAEDYAERLKEQNVKYLVRTCESMYDDSVFTSRGIQIQELYFTDGAAPPRHIIIRWLDIVRSTFVENGKLKYKGDQIPCIAVHCLAGLGRAPVLVAIALIEAGLDYQDAVKHIRKNRHGALNTHQLDFLRSYRTMGLYKNKGCCMLL